MTPRPLHMYFFYATQHLRVARGKRLFFTRCQVSHFDSVWPFPFCSYGHLLALVPPHYIFFIFYFLIIFHASFQPHGSTLAILRLVTHVSALLSSQQTNRFWCIKFNHCGICCRFCCICGLCVYFITLRMAYWLFKDMYVHLPQQITFMLHNLHWLLFLSHMGHSLTILTLQHCFRISFFPMSLHVFLIRDLVTRLTFWLAFHFVTVDFQTSVMSKTHMSWRTTYPTTTRLQILFHVKIFISYLNCICGS